MGDLKDNIMEYGDNSWDLLGFYYPNSCHQMWLENPKHRGSNGTVIELNGSFSNTAMFDYPLVN